MKGLLVKEMNNEIKNKRDKAADAKGTYKMTQQKASSMQRHSLMHDVTQ
jgi:hypothetical protein